MKKRILCMFLTAVLTLTMLPPALAAGVNEELTAGELAEEMPAYAASSGTCGKNLTWTLSDSGLLTISGSGDIVDFSSETSDWESLRGSVRRVVIESGAESILTEVFSGWPALTSIVIPGTVTYIAPGAFRDCTALTAVSFAEGLNTISYESFSGCTSLASVTFPSTVKSIGNSAFSGCTSLVSVMVPASVTGFGMSVFGGCTGLKTAGPVGGGYDFEFGWTEAIPSFMFEQCTALAEVTLPDTVTTIGPSAFNACSSLTSVTLSAGLTEIGSYAFAGCYALTAVKFPAGLTEIGKRAFYLCYALTSVTLPASVQSIGTYAFESCRSLSSFTIPETVTGFAKGIFYNCPGLETAGPIGGGYDISFGWKDAIPAHAFSTTSDLKTVTIPASIKHVGDNAFAACNGMTDVYFLGTEDEWNNIEFGVNPYGITFSNLHFSAAEAPAAPTGLTAENKSSGTSLTWDEVSGAESYVVMRNGVKAATVTSTSYTDKDVESGTEYTYAVKAVKNGLHSVYSVPLKNMFLSMPANVSCENTAEGIRVTWDAVEGATGYTLYRRLSGSSSWSAVFTSTKASTLSKTDTGVTGGKTYFYTVRANCKGSDGTWFSAKGATGKKIECKLTASLEAPAVKSIVNGFSSILVKWNKVTGADGYYVYRKAENSSTWTKLKTVKQPASGSTVSFGNTTPKNGETYTYKVAAYKGTTLSADSNEKTYMRLTYPTLTAKSGSAGKISFSWTDNSAATSFQIEYTTAETFTGATRKTLTEYKTSTSYSGFESGKTYHVRVRAYVKYWNNAEGKYMYYYGTWSSADETGDSTQTVKVK